MYRDLKNEEVLAVMSVDDAMTSAEIKVAVIHQRFGHNHLTAETLKEAYDMDREFGFVLARLMAVGLIEWSAGNILKYKAVFTKENSNVTENQ